MTSRIIAVVALLAAVLAYSVAVVSGAIPKDRQIDSAHLTLIALAMLVSVVILRPHILRKIDQFEGLGFKLKLERLQDRQDEQAELLDNMDILVPLLFRDADRKHLINLARGRTKDYKGGAAVREELRRLRSIDLIAMTAPDRHIGDLHSTRTFDLADWVKLTDVGRRWASRLKRLEEAAAETPSTSDSPQD